MARKGQAKVANKAVSAEEAALFHEDAIHREVKSTITTEQGESYSQNKTETVQRGQAEDQDAELV